MDLQGWDVINASDVHVVNQVLAASTMATLPTFSFTDSSLGIAFSGQFGPWAIQPGGSANRIKLMTPITSGTLTAPQFRAPIDLAGVQPILDVALVLIEGSSTGTQDLTFAIETNSVTPSTRDGDVYLANPDASGTLHREDPSGMAEQIFNDWFAQVFVANKDEISFVFATVILNPNDAPWLAPKSTAVSYFESGDGQTQSLCIKSLTQAPWGPDGLSTAVDPSLFGQGDDYIFAMAPAVFLDNLLLPSAASALKVSASALRFNPPTSASQPESASITNAQDLPMGKVHSGAIDYYPKLTQYKVVITGSQIVTTAAGKFDITGLHDAYVTFDNITVVSEMGYDAATGQATFRVVSQTDPHSTEHIPWYEKELTWIIPIIGLVENMVMDIVVDSIESAVKDALSSSGHFSINAIPVASAVWSGLDQFQASDARLDSALEISASGAR